MELEIFIQIAALIGIIAFIFLAVYLIVFLKNTAALLGDTKKTVDKLSVDLTTEMKKVSGEIVLLRTKFNESLENWDGLTHQMTQTSQTIDREVKAVSAIFDPIRNLVDMLVSKISPPISQTAAIISSVSKAVNVFTQVLLRK